MFFPRDVKPITGRINKIPRWSIRCPRPRAASRTAASPRLPCAPSPALYTWLKDPQSLTAKLIASSQHQFRVQVVRQTLGRAQTNECLALRIKTTQRCLIREVILVGQEQPWVFARSILPLSSLTGRLRHLRYRGSKPLGAFLFSQPDLERHPIAVALINRHHNYVPIEYLDNDPVWGRRSIFVLDNKPLLVSEVFLPPFVRRLNQSGCR